MQPGNPMARHATVQGERRTPPGGRQERVAASRQGLASTRRVEGAHFNFAGLQNYPRTLRLDQKIERRPLYGYVHLRCNDSTTVYRTRQQLVEGGFEAVLSRKQRTRPPVAPIFDGEKEAN
jgi:hypothetical protein